MLVYITSQPDHLTRRLESNDVTGNTVLLHHEPDMGCYDASLWLLSFLA